MQKNKQIDNSLKIFIKKDNFGEIVSQSNIVMGLDLSLFSRNIELNAIRYLYENSKHYTTKY